MDPFELQVFQEALTTRAADEERSIAAKRQQKEIETISQTAASYGSFSKLKNKKKKKDLLSSLPSHLTSNMGSHEFGIGTLPSDNMGMVMNNEFGNDFIRKMMERQAIEKELVRMSTLQAKNAKHNIYVTKAQALRDAVTLGAMRQKEADEASNAYYEKNHVPKMWKAGSGRSQSQKALTITPADEKSLPPLKDKTNEEAEIMNLINKNLIQDRAVGSKVSRSLAPKAKKEKKEKLIPANLDPLKPKEPLAPIVPVKIEVKAEPSRPSES